MQPRHDYFLLDQNVTTFPNFNICVMNDPKAYIVHTRYLFKPTQISICLLTLRYPLISLKLLSNATHLIPAKNEEWSEPWSFDKF